jgi:Domain of unknown function (DUF6484)
MSAVIKGKLGHWVGTVVGTVVRVAPDGRPFVEFPGHRGELPARTTVSTPTTAPGELLGWPVLLIFEDADPSRPIIVGFVRDSLTVVEPVQQPLRKARVLIEGEEEIVLRCGEGSICLTADGRIVIKGTRLMSRASETNKVRGAVVLIN